MTTSPPFKTSLGLKNALWFGIDVPCGDGEQRHWPGKPNYRPSSDVNYRIKLGGAWADNQGISKVQYGNYYLNNLPKGYATFEMDQPTGNQVYKRLFGHPSGRFFDSVIKFEVHFLWLMSRMAGNCTCVLCMKRQPLQTSKFKPQSLKVRDAGDMEVRPRRPRELQIKEEDGSTRSNSSSRPATLASGRERRQQKPQGEVYAVDEEGTSDVYKDILLKLYKARDSRIGIEDDIDERNSIDWRAEHGPLITHFTQIEQQHSFIPRLGELVLWCNYIPDNHYLTSDPSTGEYKFYSFEQQCFHGFPDWRGGVITAVPTSSASDTVDFPDILEKQAKTTAFNTSGFRVETLPNPNSFDKSLSKQYRYVPLCHIRPLSHWQLLLRGIDPEKLHSSIYNALTCMTSVSLLKKFWFKGSWPDVAVKCKGIYIGSELITIGDAVRILPSSLTPSPFQITGLPKPTSKCSEILVVSSIRLNLEAIQPEHVEPQSPALSSRSTITLVGSAYTLDPARDYHLTAVSIPELNATPKSALFPLPREQVKSLFRPVGTGTYGDWYPLHPEHQRYELSFERVLGRLYEAEAVRLWTGLSQRVTRNGEQRIPTLDFDVPGIKSARAYATATDGRIPASAANEVRWHWADTRALGLSVATFNGLEVGPYHDIRDAPTLRAWRAMLRIVDGGSLEVWTRDTRLRETKGRAGGADGRGRKLGSRLVNGKVIGPGEEVEVETDVDGYGYSDMGARRKGMSLSGSQSQMASAARADDFDDNSNAGGMKLGVDEGDGEDGKGEEGDEYDAQGPSGNPSSASISRSRSRPRAKIPRTKEQIMTSIETGYDGNSDDDGFEDEDDDALAFLNDPPPLLRGGTEESEGGDYNPRIEDFQRDSSAGGRGRGIKRAKWGW